MSPAKPFTLKGAMIQQSGDQYSAEAAPSMHRNSRQRMRRIVMFLVIGLMMSAFTACGLQRSVLFPRHAVQFDPNTMPPTGGERWTHDTLAGEVEAWFLPSEVASADCPAPAVIFAHGNGEVIDRWPAKLEHYRRMGISVLLPEYRGYGRSAGSPSEEAILADFEVFYDQLAARPDVDDGRIVFHGRSLGGAVLGTLSTRRKPAALITESSFTSVTALARRFGIPRSFVSDRFEAIDAVRQYEGPMLILHGRNDSMIPVAHAHQLHEAVPQSELILYPTDHNDPMPQPDYWNAIEAFLQHASIIQKPATP
ncbi:MAG: alpha/beta hydrolase [Dehalococcoidia bacterium]